MALIVVLVAAGTSGVGRATAATGPPTATVYVSAKGVDGNPGTASAPVATFGRAYKLATPGATVEVAAGHYGPQLLARDRSKRSSQRVVFRPAPGAVVKLELLDFGQDQRDLIGPEHVTVRGMAIRYIRAWAGSRDLVWQNIHGAHFDVFDATDVLIRGGDFGPCQAPRDDASCVSRIAGRAARVTVDGVKVHGVTSTDLVKHHVDGMFIWGGRNIVIRNSKFWGNMVTNIRVQHQLCCKTVDLLIENNWFDAPLEGDGRGRRSNAIDGDSGMRGLVVRNNSFVDSGLQLAGRYTRSRITGNLFTNLPCAPGMLYSRNLFVPFSRFTGQAPCGRFDRKVAGFGYVDAALFDLRLRPTSRAFAAGNPKDCPSTDIRGRPRLLGLKCDAGAYERQEAWVCQRRDAAKRAHRRTVLVGLLTVKARLKGGATMGRCKKR